MRKMLPFAAFVIVLTTATASAQSMEAWAGTWKLNVAKSTYDPGPRPPVPPTSNTTVLEMVNGVMRITTDAVNAQGQPNHQVRMAIFDGNPHDSEGSTNKYIYRWIDRNHYEWTTVVDGRPTTTTRLELSADGRTQTLRTTGTNAQGQRVNNVTIFEKQ